MRVFSCPSCAGRLFIENSVCLTCGAAVAFDRAVGELVEVTDEGPAVCANVAIVGCTWVAEAPGGFCFSCRLTRTRPADDDVAGMAQYAIAERAKRHLVIELDTLGLPLEPRDDNTGQGLAFDLLSSINEPVTTGHDEGIVTIDLAEGDSVHRERVRRDLAEPYRTLLGHLRHEVGHYFEAILAVGDDLDRIRATFGDDTLDYGGALDRHYRDGPPPDWESRFISAYATMHPFEDFAETFAHVLHIRDTIGSAAAHGLVTVDPEAFSSFRDLVAGVWIPLSVGLNQINRSMGAGDLYPFVLPDPVLDKLDLVAELIRGAQGSATLVR